MDIIPETVLVAVVSLVTATLTVIITGLFKQSESHDDRDVEMLHLEQVEVERIKDEATKVVIEAATSVVQQVQEENAKLRSMFNTIHGRLVELETSNRLLQDELSETRRNWKQAKSVIEAIVQWFNVYTPELERAGIEPPKIDLSILEKNGDEKWKF